MNFSKETLQVLRHFSKFTGAIAIEPDQHLYIVSEEGDALYARARIEHNIPKAVNCHDISLLVSLIELFDGKDYDVEFNENDMMIMTKNGRMSQNFVYSAKELLRVPNPEKIDKFFEQESEVKFTLSDTDLKTFKTALDKTKATNVVIETVDGKLCIYGADMSSEGTDQHTANSFKIDLDTEIDDEVKLIFSSDVFRLADGTYQVEVSENFSIFRGQIVDYILPKLKT